MIKNNLNLYQIFYIVAQSNSYAEASNILKITTPAICKNIRVLETGLNRKLFYKNNQGIKLTMDGKILLNDIEKGLAIIKNAETKIMDKNNLENGELYIGCPSHVFNYYFIDKIAQAKKDFPNLKFHFETGVGGKSLLQALKEHKISFMIDNSHLEVTDSKIIVDKLLTTHNIFVSNKPINITRKNDIEKLPIIITTEFTHTTRNLVKCMKDHNINANLTIFSDITEQRVEMTKKGIGVSYVIKELIQNELDNNELFEVKIPFELPESSINLIYFIDSITETDMKFINKYLKKGA